MVFANFSGTFQKSIILILYRKSSRNYFTWTHGASISRGCLVTTYRYIVNVEISTLNCLSV
ncbi:hypothetical protein [Caudoviricetes sp.]|nr:hypothetical protein [Caudoviricetes sp.]